MKGSPVRICLLLLLLLIPAQAAADTYLFVYSTPSGASIYLNGSSLGVGSVTPREQHAVPGTYTLLLTKTGYPDYSSTITIADGQTYVVDWDFDHKKLISVAPTVSSITPSGGAAGTTVSITNLAGSNFASNAFFTLTRTGYPDISASGVSVNADGTKMTGTLDLTGQTPGTYSVCAFNTAFIYACGSSFTVTAAGSGTTTTAAAGADANTSVSFETDPAGATIYLDNREIGTSPFTYTGATPGSAHVLIRKGGYRNYSASIYVLEGKHVTFSAGLTPLDEENAVGTAGTTPVPATETPSPARTAVLTRKTLVRTTTTVPDTTTSDEESPVDPVVALAALALGIAAFRRS